MCGEVCFKTILSSGGASETFKDSEYWDLMLYNFVEKTKVVQLGITNIFVISKFIYFIKMINLQFLVLLSTKFAQNWDAWNNFKNIWNHVSANYLYWNMKY